MLIRFSRDAQGGNTDVADRGSSGLCPGFTNREMRAVGSDCLTIRACRGGRPQLENLAMG